MKKFTYILMIFLGLSVVSCEKQTITPNDESDNTVLPTMRSAKIGGAVVLGGEDDLNSTNTDITDPKDNEDVLDADGNVITDPKDNEVILIDENGNVITDPKDRGRKRSH